MVSKTKLSYTVSVGTPVLAPILLCRDTIPGIPILNNVIILGKRSRGEAVIAQKQASKMMKVSSPSEDRSPHQNPLGSTQQPAPVQKGSEITAMRRSNAGVSKPKKCQARPGSTVIRENFIIIFDTVTKKAMASRCKHCSVQVKVLSLAPRFWQGVFGISKRHQLCRKGLHCRPLSLCRGILCPLNV